MYRYDRVMLILLATACSGGSDRASTRDSAAAMTSGAAEPDSAGSAANDSTVSAAPADTTTGPKTQSATVAQTPAPKPRVRPSIDPGRKSSTTAPSSAQAAPSDTASSDTAPAAAPSSSGQNQNLKYDAATNTVTFQLIGGPSGFQFNGYSSGGATLTLPPKANVVIHFVNKDGTPHSAEVISGEGPIPNGSTDPAIPRAYTNKALEGLPQEASDDMKFTVPESGTYRIFCGVPGHGLSGMWIWMKIDPAAKTPSFGPTKA